MKAYGLIEIECPDVADIQSMGVKSSTGRFRERGGDFKPYCRDASSRNRTRRYWKRQARAEGKAECREAALGGE